MGRNLDIKQSFENYFHKLEGFTLRAERFYDDLEVSPLERRQLLMKAWLEAAFLEGARVMAKDTLEALDDYSTAVVGINEVCYNRTQAYDTAAANLKYYYDGVLKDI